MTEQAHPEWDASYTADTSPPWDIGRPQPTFVRLADQGHLPGCLLDAGCGTGENALLAASRCADRDRAGPRQSVRARSGRAVRSRRRTRPRPPQPSPRPRPAFPREPGQWKSPSTSTAKTPSAT
jgi:hypothetical protein